MKCGTVARRVDCSSRFSTGICTGLTAITRSIPLKPETYSGPNGFAATLTAGSYLRILGGIRCRGGLLEQSNDRDRPALKTPAHDGDVLHTDREVRARRGRMKVVRRVEREG